MRQISTLLILFTIGCAGNAPVTRPASVTPATVLTRECIADLAGGQRLAFPCAKAKIDAEGYLGSEFSKKVPAVEGPKHKAWIACEQDLCAQGCPAGEEIIWFRGTDRILRHGSTSCACEATHCSAEPRWRS